MYSMAPPEPEENALPEEGNPLDAYRNLGDILTVRDVAQFLLVDDSTIRNRINEGWLRAFNVLPGGGSGRSAIRIHKADLIDFIKNSTVVPSPRKKGRGKRETSSGGIDDPKEGL